MKKTAFILAALLTASLLYPAARDTSAMPAYAPEVLVVYKADFSSADIDAFNSKHSVALSSRREIISFLEKIYKITPARRYLPKSFFSCYLAPDKLHVEDLAAGLKAEPVIDHAQPNYLFYAQTAAYVPLAGPDDYYYKTVPSQWYINQIRSDKVYADTALFSSIIPVRDVIVAVVDTGVGIGTFPYGHEDLAGVTVTGINIIDPAVLPYDDNGHGTHVSALIAATTGNALGMASASLNITRTARVRIMPVKALDLDGSGSDADIYTGIVWAADSGADIINLSLGGASADLILKTGINYAYGKGCLIIAASGNSDAETFYPAAYSNVMSVAASDMLFDSSGNTYDVKADFSNYGKIDIAAPGVNIFSAANTGYSQYTQEDGTSFSSPIVAGVAALVKLKYPDNTNDMIRNILEQSADDDYHVCAGTVYGKPGYDKYFGWGRVNAYKALNLDTAAVTTTDIVTYNWPNPFSPETDQYTNITFTISSRRKVTISIYDGGNELVWEKVMQSSDVSPSGQNIVKWNGKNRENRNVANGVYFYAVKTDSGTYGKNKIAVVY